MSPVQSNRAQDNISIEDKVVESESYIIGLSLLLADEIYLNLVAGLSRNK